ncbi:MAG: GTP cyclohydrolase I FolE2 [Desulfobulbaceae bacterium]|uniref:GTP cyclohydrolase I FolE2 n=1 Tax=Candidatus Desulfobia pelagia TaxID=2841692 RepID=A0A8J6NDE1_9BACT|nr:GTP cyclohydrolase I FolE2 [Candidatus Desulfobia pelagia]
MKDIQSQPDYRRISIKKVGVKDISYPVTVLDRAKKVQKTVAKVNMYVNLPHQFKGTHMSRFVEILNDFHGEIKLKSFHRILEEMKEKLQAEAAHIEIEFPYFLKKKRGPGRTVMGEYLCRMHGSLQKENDLILEIEVPVAPPAPVQTGSGLPESLGLWGVVTTSLRFQHFIWIEDIISMVEEITNHDLQWSSALAKPQDNSLSVEGIANAIGNTITNLTDISWFSVNVENFAKGFSTFASLEWPENYTPPQ